LVIAKALGFGVVGSYEPTDRLCADVSRMLIAMMNKLKS
jgi:hypothetical protein